MRRILVTLSASFVSLAGLPALAQDETSYSGTSFCDGEIVHAYMVHFEGLGFQIFRKGMFGDYEMIQYDGDLAPGMFAARRQDRSVSIRDVGSDRITLDWNDDTCASSVELSRRPDPLEAYKEAKDFAETADLTPADAIVLSDMLFNLAPSGLLPRLDQGIAPQATYDVANGFLQRYVEARLADIASAPLASQADADALVKAVAAAFPVTLGYKDSLFDEEYLSRTYAQAIGDAALRISVAGFDVSPMMEMDETRFCTYVQGITFNRADRFEPLFGLPFSHWDRPFTEAAIERVAACGGQWGAEKADRLAVHYPNIAQANDALQSTIEAGRRDQEIIGDIRARIAALEALPNTVQSYIDTGGYRYEEVQLDRTASREVRDAVDTLYTTSRRRVDEAESVLSEYLQTRFVFDEDQYLSDDWKQPGIPGMKDARCDIAELGDVPYMVEAKAQEICQAAIYQAASLRREVFCDRAIDRLDIDQEELDQKLLIGFEPSPLVVDRSLKELICLDAEGSTISWKKASGLFSSGYAFTNTSNADPTKSTTALFEEDAERGGYAPTEIKHSIGGDLSNVHMETQMICLVNPEYNLCEG